MKLLGWIISLVVSIDKGDRRGDVGGMGTSGRRAVLRGHIRNSFRRRPSHRHAREILPPRPPGIQHPSAHDDLKATHVAVLMILVPRDVMLHRIGRKARVLDGR